MLIPPSSVGEIFNPCFLTCARALAEPTYIDYSAFVILIGIVEFLVAALIVWNAWKWPKQEG